MAIWSVRDGYVEVFVWLKWVAKWLCASVMFYSERISVFSWKYGLREEIECLFWKLRVMISLAMGMS